MSTEECIAARHDTVNQSKSPLWVELKYGRITASRKSMKPQRCETDDGSLVETILGAFNIPETMPMKRGLELEDKVLKRCEEDFKIKVQRCGLVLNPEYPMLGASPDGVR